MGDRECVFIPPAARPEPSTVARPLSPAPGDRGIVLVKPWEGTQPSPWSCERCPERIPIGNAWQLHHRDPSGRTTVHVLGPLCAYELMPVRVTIDLVAAERRRERLPTVTSLLDHIRERRLHPPRYELTLRSTDVHLLALIHEESPVDFAIRLRDAGVLISL